MRKAKRTQKKTQKRKLYRRKKQKTHRKRKSMKQYAGSSESNPPEELRRNLPGLQFEYTPTKRLKISDKRTLGNNHSLTPEENQEIEKFVNDMPIPKSKVSVKSKVFKNYPPSQASPAKEYDRKQKDLMDYYGFKTQIRPEKYDSEGYEQFKNYINENLKQFKQFKQFKQDKNFIDNYVLFTQKKPKVYINTVISRGRPVPTKGIYNGKIVDLNPDGSYRNTDSIHIWKVPYARIQFDKARIDYDNNSPP